MTKRQNKKNTFPQGLKGRVLLLLLFFIITGLYADGGLIPFFNSYHVHEPGQTAVIGWNGTKETMILSTDVFSSGRGWVIELIPFPALPEPPYAVEGQDPSAPINRVKNIIKERTAITMRGDVNEDYSSDIVDALLVAQHYVDLNPPNFNKFAGDMNNSNTVDITDALIIAKRYVNDHSTPTPAPGGYTPSPGATIAPTPVVIYHEVTRVHDLTIVQAQNSTELIDYAESLLSRKTSTQYVSWAAFQNVAEQYIAEEGIQYWCIDLLDLDENRRQREPIVYNFSSNRMFFPLKISRINYGYTEINVYTITKTELDRQDIASVNFTVRNIDTFFDLTNYELQSINADIYKLFDVFSSPSKLAQLQFKGYLSNLVGDLKVKSINN